MSISYSLQEKTSSFGKLHTLSSPSYFNNSSGVGLVRFIFRNMEALTSAYAANSQVEKALELLEHVAAMEAKVVKEDHPSRLFSQHLPALRWCNTRQTREPYGFWRISWQWRRGLCGKTKVSFMAAACRGTFPTQPASKMWLVNCPASNRASLPVRMAQFHVLLLQAHPLPAVEF